MPKRGEIWLVDLGMAQKTRPAVILNVPYGDTDRVIVTVVTHTTSLPRLLRAPRVIDASNLSRKTRS